MAIIGQEIINVGVENQATGADSIFEAFNKTQNNFVKLFDNASQYVNFVGGNGINTVQGGNTVTIKNTGVINICLLYSHNRNSNKRSVIRSR